METPRVLPVGVQTFEDIRKKELLYIDKTRYI
ncbi:MAG: AAA family ATPase, partial [Bacteroides sp.]